jgi:hypothetical protein
VCTCRKPAATIPAAWACMNCRQVGPTGVAAQHRVLVPDYQQSAAGPQIMASLRNLAITILRLAGTTSIAAALRYHARRPARPLRTIMKC